MQFSELPIISPILKALEKESYTEPTPIQERAIPELLRGNDVLGCAQTGTGKTAAFSIPILQLLHKNDSGNKNRKIRSLILTPTRELAIQIGESLDAYGRYLPLKNTVVFGGVSQNKQTNKLKEGIDILVATPGRLLDLIGQGFIELKNVEFFVLDEADRMLDMGFINDVKKVLKLLPKKRQNLFFSATMIPEILSLANSILQNPIRIEVTPVSSTAERISQEVYFVDKKNKKDLLLDILKEDDAQSVLVFSRTKHGCNKIVKILKQKGVNADAIHGNKSQNHRQKALGMFKDRKIRVLVATDIAARGIDVDEMELVINYDLPNIPETYVHRIGRTGRAGNEGRAISFSDFEEKAYLKAIEKLTNKKVTVIEEHPYPMEVFEVIKKKTRPPRSNRTKTGSSKKKDQSSFHQSPTKSNKSRHHKTGR